MTNKLGSLRLDEQSCSTSLKGIHVSIIRRETGMRKRKINENVRERKGNYCGKTKASPVQFASKLEARM